MKLVLLLLVAFALGCVRSGPIDDGLLPEQSSRQVSDDDVDAVVVDVGRPRRPYDLPRRRFLGPFFDRDEDDDGGYGPPPPSFGFRPYGWGFGHRPYGGGDFGQRPYGGGGGGGFVYRPYADDFFTRLREQMDAVRRYLTSILNGTSDFGPFDHLPPNYDNSTYTTKVVNGSVISVNETVKKHSTNDSSFVFKFKVVQVRPHNETNPEDGGNVEPVEPVVPVFPGPVVPEKPDESQSTVTPSVEATTSTVIDTDNEMDNDVGQGRQFR